jgi:outer membrane protein TolC
VYFRVLLILFLLYCGLPAQENKISLAFGDIPPLLEKSSPQLKMINADKNIAETQRDIALQWSNPEIYYTREEVKNNDLTETQQLFYLSKTFTFPWNYLKEKHIWQENLTAAELERELGSRQLLATTRTEYVRASLLNTRIENQTTLNDILKKLKLAVSAREEEGAISKMESGLLTMSIFAVESDIIQTQTEFRQSLNSLKQFLGIGPSAAVILSTMIGFARISDSSVVETDSLLNHPGVKAQRARLSALKESVSLEKSRIMSSFSLQGGYKSINQDWQGYSLGISLPLPILNWNRPQVEEQSVRQKRQSEAHNLYKQRLLLERENLILSIKARMDLIQETEIERQKFTIVEDLLAAYQEGAISLTEFLNGILMYRDSARQYTGLLTDYYQAIFQLEALNGQQLITF